MAATRSGPRQGDAGGAIVLAGMADNAGGGAPSDATFILRAMLERGMGDAVPGCIWDPGGGLGISLGGKVGHRASPQQQTPIRIE